MASEWTQRTNYTLGHVVVNPRLGKQWYICTKAGRSGNPNPFDKYTDAEGDTIVDYQVNWLCYTFGGVGCAKFVYGSDTAILSGENLEIKWTYGNPNTTIWPIGKENPRSAVYLSGEEVLQITGVLKGPGTPAEKAAFKSLFKNQFGHDPITLTLTGDAATAWGSTLNVMHFGGNALKITSLRGHRYLSIVDIQVLVVDNTL